MAPPPRVVKAFRAMKDLGIGEDIVKPVLKKLVKVYEKNWELIEEENYRVLADAIFEYEETKAAEQKNKSKNSGQDNDLEEEAQLHDEPERPLKRLRLRSQDGQGSSSSRKLPEDAEQPGSCPIHESEDMTESPQLNVGNIEPPPVLAAQESSGPSKLCATNGTQPDATKRSESVLVSSQIHLKDKGKEPISPLHVSKEMKLISGRSHRTLQIKEPVIALLSKQKVPESHEFTQPKDEPFSDDISQYAVPIAVIHPEPPSKGASTGSRADVPEHQAPECENGQDNDEGIPRQASSSKKGINYELSDTAKGSPTKLDIASSSLGEVKISISCKSAPGRPEFHMPNIDAVVKTVEDRCLRSYKVIEPNLSLRKLMRDVCECFLELGTDSVDEPPQERPINVAPLVDSLKNPARDALSGKCDKENGSMLSSSSNGSVNARYTATASAPQTQGYQATLDGNSDQRQLDKDNVENDCDITEKENEHKGTEQPQLTPHDIRLLHDVNDIARGEEKVKIPWVNEINNEHPPPFHYIPQNLVFKKAHLNFSLAQIGDDGCCSQCFGNCLSSSVPCACTHEFEGEFAYTLEGLLKEVFLEECKGHLATKIIRECWSKCGCHKQCGNRLVQRGITCSLQVFLTPEGKGWGLRTLEDLPKGAFVCEYVGEILTHTELRERKRTNSSQKHVYTVLLDADRGSEGLKDEEALCLDARCYGNVARFINHRCSDTNLVEIPVQVETPDPHYYHLAFFTSRRVNALEELTWDYGIDFDDQSHSIKAFRCVCGSGSCRDMKRMN